MKILPAREGNQSGNSEIRERRVTAEYAELATGKLMWEQPQTGSGTISRFADHLLILTENGELKLVQASPKEFKLKGQCQVVGRTTRNYPALVDGFAYVRGPKQLVCLDLRVKK